MSTSETVDFALGPCPCGAGIITKSITTQDNPWSSADVCHRIDCTRCASEWQLEHNQLVQIDSKKEYDTAWQHELDCASKLRALAVQLADQYFQEFAATTKKAEHQEMVRLRISNGGYPAYLKQRKTASPGRICMPTNNLEWVAELAVKWSAAVQFDALKIAYEHARSRREAASKKIIRKRLPEMTL